MIRTLRAALAALLLFGFYLYAFGIVVALGALTVLLIDVSDAVAGSVVEDTIASRAAEVTLVLAGAILVATWKVLRAKPEPLPGLVLNVRRAPDLWAEVRRIAAAVGTRAPDEIRLVPDVKAAVSEDAGLLGLRGGRRYLYIGMPLMQAFSVSQLRAVLAHELGHYSQKHTRFGELTYRGWNTMAQIIARMGPTSIGGWLLRGYAAVYRLVSATVNRRQEIEADRASVRVAGRRAAVDALRALPGLALTWEHYLNRYVRWGLDSGYVPADVLANFPRLLEVNATTLAEMRGAESDAQRSRYDTHPPIPTRVALIEREPEPRVVEDQRPATVLLRDPQGAAAALEREVFDFGERRRVPFPEYTAAAATYEQQRVADVLYRAATRVAGAGGGNLQAVLGLLAAGRAEDLLGALLPPADLADREVARGRFREYLAAAFTAALVTAGAARWRHSWSAPVSLVGPDGDPVDPDDLVDAAMGGRIDDVMARLSAAGVDLSTAGVREAVATARGASTVAGLVNVVVDGKRSDLVILDTGLVVVPGVRRLKMKSAKSRMREMLTSVPPEKLASRPGHRYLPYEEIVSGRLTRRIPRTYELRMRDGTAVTVRWGGESQEMSDGWKALAAVVARVETPA